jgi:hypothetical protein
VNIKGYGRTFPLSKSLEIRGESKARHRLSERHTDATFFPPDNITALSSLVRHHVQRDFVRNAYWARDIERSTSRREVANRAVNAGAIELNRSGLEDSSSWC